ncbi:DUF979 domain-containing protein [Herbaspirillum sp. RTI4]|uniref:DUF979 domain-containing protein n=1 Tax=Herbaspirillum sp. RTI4 TaxID=3048640 RepID=UPI002AB5A258|nr:DUF979 domain-containing protein [Herbaspirillum sp. RTI4]MDY7577228.1 DUF979 domain-containing protein [Herbaspirillum sp. RTI4]MEA9980518.1 DUF979 domain-containing protein [Herbaspirillum sp. RTI4]
MSTLLTLNEIYYLIGVILMLLVGMTLRDKGNPKRLTTALFWFLFGSVFLFSDLLVSSLGKPLAYRIIGAMVILMSLIAGGGLLSIGSYKQRSAEMRQASANRIGNWIFLPALLIPIVTVLCTVFLKGVSIGGVYLLDQKQLTLAALCVGCICAILTGWKLTGGTPLHAVRESRRLLDAIGWAAVLPQMLAMLGGVFVAAHTGKSVQDVVSLFINPDSRLMLVVIYCVGMALFAMIMGNAFAAFPVMTAGIALPFLIVGQHADPAPLVTMGMLAGYCGTLMTPMAANFNIVPAALLELKDKYLVIKVQIPTALTLLAANIVLMYFIIFR